MKWKSCIVIVVLMLTSAISSIGFATAAPPKGKVYGKPRSDSALVYLYRKGAFAAGGRALKIFCDERLVAVLKNNTYSFTYLKPGTHFFWCNFSNFGKEHCDLAPGRTYYLSYHVTDGMALLSESDGAAAIEKASRYIELTEKEEAKVVETIAKKWPKEKEKSTSKIAESEEIVYTLPTETEGIKKVPAGTPISTELMENVCSGLNKSGDPVWLRVRSDVQVGGGLFVRAGTPVKAFIRDTEERRGFGRGGKMDFTVVSVVAEDGTVCPLVGQLVATGKKASQAGTAAATVAGGLVAGAIVASLTKGAESFHAIGTTFDVYTRQDVWFAPKRDIDEETPARLNPAVVLKAYPKGEITCKFKKAEVSRTVEIAFDGAADLTAADLVRVEGVDIPEPLRAAKIARSGETWVAEFPGWDVVRFMRTDGAETRILFRLSFQSGAESYAEGTIPIAVK